MDSKRAITLFPIVFLCIIGALLLLGFFYQKSVNENNNAGDVLGVDCTEKFVDDGLGVNFSYPCFWDLSLDTNIEDTFVISDDNEYGYLAKKFNVILIDDSQKITIRVVFGDTEGSFFVLNDKYDFEVIENQLVRYSKKEGEYRYGQYFECTELEGKISGDIDSDSICAGTMILDIADELPSIVLLDDPKDLELVDKFILSLI